MRLIRKWTDEEELLLKKYYPISTKDELRNIFPDRTDRSIARKAGNLGLTKLDETISRIGRESKYKSYRDEFPEVNRESLEDLYVNKKLSSRDVGRKLGCSSDLVLRRLREYGLPIRERVGDPSFTVEERKEKWGRPGANHPRWKGGITSISNIIRNRLYHVSLERFKIDGFKCVECGGGEHRLNAHHIRPFSEIVADIREEHNLHDLTAWESKEKLANICENDERLLDINNLITLCEDCHKAVHAGEKEAMV